MNSQNLPEKSNFQNRKGIEAITGSGNFDISEWMLLKYIEWLTNRQGTIAILCKYSVARKAFRQMQTNNGPYFEGHVYPFDAKEYFNASVDACLFVLISTEQKRDCIVYDDIQTREVKYEIGERDGFVLKDVKVYERLKHLRGQAAKYIWRSGVKHDCSKIMEFTIEDSSYRNGLNEEVKLEKKYLYPLLKSSDVANGRTNTWRKEVLITQKKVGEETKSIAINAPKTWDYLLKHRDYLDKRTSSIYRDKPDFSVFGIGPYTFKEWKIAISGMYKKLSFEIVGPLGDRLVIFDDTVYFLSFDTEEEANFIYTMLTSIPAQQFFESMIFWDEKRPITAAILRRLSLKSLSQELDLYDKYMSYSSYSDGNQPGQLSLGIAENSSDYSTQASNSEVS
ncbi:MAG: SAM-dependent methyltransferase [Proteobacteria bacterium]|nr:SAM-dependent methyltransferase [Pseudomonadota bacterium]